MAELVNAQLINFTNESLRVLADNLQVLSVALPQIVAVYNARNLGTVINAGGPSELLTDGSAVDGRTRVTGGDVFNLITLAQDLVAFLTRGRLDVIAKWQVNGLRGLR